MDMVKTKDGTLHPILDRRDVLELVENTGGSELREAVEAEFEGMAEDYEYSTTEADEAKKRMEDMQHSYQDKLHRLDEESKSLAGIIQENAINRKALSGVCGRIRSILSTAPF